MHSKDFETSGSLQGAYMAYEDQPDLPLGFYCAVEGDIGVPVRPFLGFGLIRRAQRLEREAVALRAEADRVIARGRATGTVGGAVRYVSPDQVETWDAVWGEGEWTARDLF